MAIAAWISIVICIDPAGSYPSMPQGPGVTVDEIFNVQQGVLLVERARALGGYNLIPGTSIDAFRRENYYNPDHPPLGRYWLGVHHQVTWAIAPPYRPDGLLVTACARTGSATAFALTIWLIGAFVRVQSPSAGSSASWAGAMTGIALVLMPRVYGHAHLASLETITNLTCTSAVLAIAAWWSGPGVPTGRSALLAGILMALALLTKIQAVLIPIPVIVWALVRWRQRALVPLLIWGMTALLVFFLLWPYLWINPVEHLKEYLGRTTNRATLYCFYFGVRYADKAVPWHYPLVIFTVTVPVVLQGLGLLGLRTKIAGASDASSANEALQTMRWQNRLLLACGLFVLLVFALPGVAVYDGERLFLTVFPLWAVFVGRGAVTLYAIMSGRVGRRLAGGAMAVVMLVQFGSNLQVHPYYLSYYNALVGGVSGAESLGMELNYWGDAMTRSVLQEAVAGKPQFASVEIRPSLHMDQNDDLMRQSPILRWARQVDPNPSTPPLRISFRRRADLSDEIYFTDAPPQSGFQSRLARVGPANP